MEWEEWENKVIWEDKEELPMMINKILMMKKKMMLKLKKNYLKKRLIPFKKNLNLLKKNLIYHLLKKKLRNLKSKETMLIKIKNLIKH